MAQGHVGPFVHAFVYEADRLFLRQYGPIGPQGLGGGRGSCRLGNQNKYDGGSSEEGSDVVKSGVQLHGFIEPSGDDRGRGGHQEAEEGDDA